MSAWCNTIRIFEAHLADESSAPYCIAMEDDSMVSEHIIPYLQKFIHVFPEEWDGLQLNPGDLNPPGLETDPQMLGEIDFNVDGIDYKTKPQLKKNIINGWGNHGLVVKKSSLPKLVECLRKVPARPSDHIPAMCQDTVRWIMVPQVPSIVQQSPMWDPNAGVNKASVEGDKLPLPKICGDQTWESDVATGTANKKIDN